MKLPDLHMYDTYVPIVQGLDVHRTWEQAVDLVSQAVAPLGDEYVSIITRGLTTERWCDKYENRGKSSGAFSCGAFDGFPYILMNYQEGEEVKLEAKSADGTRKTLSFPLKYDEELQRYRMGFTVAARGSLAEEISRQGFFPALGEVIAESFWYTGFEIEVTIRSLGILLTGKVGIDALTGPIGMVSVVGDTYQEAARYGFMTVLASISSIIVLISANLGVLNLFPIPGLDGSRLVFLAIEKIRKKPMDPKIENIIYIIGFVLLFGLMIAVAFNDILRLIH